MPNLNGGFPPQVFLPAVFKGEGRQWQPGVTEYISSSGKGQIPIGSTENKQTICSGMLGTKPLHPKGLGAKPLEEEQGHWDLTSLDSNTHLGCKANQSFSDNKDTLAWPEGGSKCEQRGFHPSNLRV